jgi:hypothetical protein
MVTKNIHREFLNSFTTTDRGVVYAANKAKEESLQNGFDYRKSWVWTEINQELWFKKEMQEYAIERKELRILLELHMAVNVLNMNELELLNANKSERVVLKIARDSLLTKTALLEKNIEERTKIIEEEKSQLKTLNLAISTKKLMWDANKLYFFSIPIFLFLYAVLMLIPWVIFLTRKS